MAEQHYLDHPRMDDLARMVTELTSEVWVLKDRVMTLEHQLAQLGVLEPEALERAPDEELAAAQQAEREALVSRVLGAPVGDDYTVDSLIERGHR